jgi:ABC-type hemin transport system substrate-binding protein
MAEDVPNEALLSHPRVHLDAHALGSRSFGRIVSLVPSLSEALVVLGLQDRLVGVTEYCVHPSGAFEALTKVGGTKDAQIQAIVALKPDLVIARNGPTCQNTKYRWCGKRSLKLLSAYRVRT